ncbi:hypothetical protein Gorai_003250 [Gossypium raimondii]|uniref:Uncharacterized protein n=1 Tax=Gossypium raimondii TaxID=29730 RepID=A0A7J8QNE1_GOSRA|nr:hypothetical protein [Gossypium raimondii]
MEEELANLILINKEEEAFREEAPVVENKNKLCTLGHWESFSPIRVRIDSSKVIFEWDISLCAVTRRRTVPVSHWLGEVDGLVCRNLDKKSGDNGHNGGNDRDIRWIWKDDLERLYLNLNYIPLGLELRH